MRRSIVWIGLAVLLGFGLIAGASVVLAANRPITLHGSLIQQPFPAPDFTLPDGKGGQFDLAAQRGRPVLIFFGYTSCADVCPATLSEMKQISQRLGQDAKRVDFVFITVDPGRDTIQRTAQYVANFNPDFYGLSGTEQQLDPVWKAYGVYRKLDKTSPTDTSYNVEHSSQVYLIDASGNLRSTYAFGTAVDDMLTDLRALLKRG